MEIKSVKVANDELKEWNDVFNDTRNWGIKTKFQKKTGVSVPTLRMVLLSGKCLPKTRSAIRKFLKSEIALQNI